MKVICYILLMIMACLLLSSCSTGQPSVFHTNSTGSEAASTANSERIPWDYKIVKGTVGDLIGSDMTILPDNQLLPNDGNYGTGQTIWTLQYMDAEITTSASERSEVHLSSWNTIKSYSDEKTANEDLAKLKISLTTEVDLVGVYKTEYQSKTRDYAVLSLPSGNRIKQPIDDQRYDAIKKQNKVQVILEEVHDYANYDMAYSKFRGWAN